MKARIIGVKTTMFKFDFLFGCVIGKTLLNQTDNLSKTLQNPKLSALEGRTIAKDIINALKKDRNDEFFKLFGELVTSLQTRLSVGEDEERFNQPDYQVYLNMQEILLKSCKSQQCENELNILAVEYADDIDLTSLRGQLKL